MKTAGRLQGLALVLLALGLPGLQPGFLLSWLAVGLVVLAGLKLREARRIEERRLVALLQLVCAGLLAALQPDLAPSLLQLLSVWWPWRRCWRWRAVRPPAGACCCAAA
jgi:hypothetical protein